MVRMKVDFPEPDGPAITSTSPRRTRRLTPRSAWNSPNHFLTSSQTMMSLPVSRRSISGIAQTSACPDAEPGFHPAAGDGHGVADDEVESGSEQVDLAHRPQELALLGDSVQDPEQLEQAD